MTADDARAVLDAIRARADAATDGPWLALADGTLDGDIVWVRHRHDDGHVDVATITAPEFAHPGDYAADAAFIAHAREDVPRLLAAVDAVLRLCADPDPDTDDGMTLVSVAAIRAAITEALARPTTED